MELSIGIAMISVIEKMVLLVEYANGTKFWYLNGQLHREDGPAIECANGTKLWHLNGQNLSEAEFNQRTSKPVSDCSGKIVEIDGKKYKLTLI